MPNAHRHPSWLLALASLLLLASCAAQQMEAKPPDRGQSRDSYLLEGVYHNNPYHFTWEVPSGWKPLEPAYLETPGSPPQPDRGYIFGWANAAQEAEVRFLVYPAPPQNVWECAPHKLAPTVARDQGWQHLSELPGQWQDRSTVQVHYSTVGGLGLPSQAVLARFVCQGGDLLVFYLQMPATDYNSLHDLLDQLLRQVTFTTSAGVKVQEALPTPLPDLVHIVKYGGETIAAIAQWYTGDANLARHILNHNLLPNSPRLSLGRRIRIPGYMVTNRDPMPPPDHRQPGARPSKPGSGSAEPEGPVPGGLLLEPIGPK